MMMSQKNKIETLLKSTQKIFSTKDLGLLWNISNRAKLKENIKYYLRKQRLKKIYKGIYTLEDNYHELELAQNLVPISYISYHTALKIHGINFQYSSEIHACALKSKSIKIKTQIFKYHQIKEEIFFNNLGISKKNNYLLANPERSICDALYLNPSLDFSNLENINHEHLLEIAEIYKRKTLIKEIKCLIAHNMK